MYKAKKWFFALSFVIAGCQSTTKLDMGYVADLRSGAEITTESIIAVMPNDKGNIAESGKYISAVVSEMRKKGYVNTFSANEITQSKRQADLALLVNVDVKNESYTKTEQTYKTETSRANGYPVRVNLPDSSRVVMESKTVYVVSLDLFDSASKTQVLSVMGYSTDEKCRNNIEDLLVQETLSRLEMQNTKNYQYRVEVPRSLECTKG